MNKKEIIIIDSGVSNTNSYLKDVDIRGKKVITKEIYQILKKNLESNFALSVYKLDDNIDMDLLYAQICEYFS